MYIITLILGIIGVVLLAFAIREDEDDRAFPLGILSVVSLICSVMLWCYTDTKHERGKAKLRMEKLRKETVEDKAEELKATNLRIEQLREELKTLTDKSIDLNSEIQKNTAETTAFEARTNATIDKVTNRLNEDKVRLAQIL